MISQLGNELRTFVMSVRNCLRLPRHKNIFVGNDVGDSKRIYSNESRNNACPNNYEGLIAVL